MKKIIIILTIVMIALLLSGCEKDPVIQDMESNSVITYYAFSCNHEGVDSLTPYAIEYTDPQYGDTLQKITFNGEWEHQMSFKGYSFKFEIYHYSYIKTGPYSSYPVPDSLYSFPDGCQPCLVFKIYVNGIRVLGGEDHNHSLCEGAIGEFYNPNGPNWNCRERIGYAYTKNDPYNPEIYYIEDYYLEN